MTRERDDQARLSVTFLPGAAGAAAFWRPVVERLPATWQVQSLDLPGLGSVPAHAGVSSYDDLADYVAPMIGIPGVVAAQSMGAYVALQLALRYPSLVTHLVLVAAAAGVDMASHGAVDWREEYATAYPQAQAWARSRVRDLSDEIGTIMIPVLLIWPTNDLLSPLTVAHAFASRIPTTSLVTFASDDHWVVHRFPDETAAALRAFIERSRT